MKVPKVPIIDVNTGKTIKTWKAQDKEFDVKYYRGYIQLHNNRTLWDINLANEIDEQHYSILLDNAIAEFESKTGQEVFLLGRSGRHVCVNDTEENRKNYSRLKRLALRLEKELIKDFNRP